MNRLFRYVAAASVAASATAVVFAQLPAPALNVNLGLWEMTTTVDMGDMSKAMAGMMDTSKMTPEQKARMEEAMKRMSGSHTSTSKTCITKEKMSKGFGGDEPGENCKDTVVTNTSSAYEVKRECTGERKETTLVHFEAAGRELVKGTMNTTIVKNGQTQNVTGTISGKWMGADCGSVK